MATTELTVSEQRQLDACIEDYQKGLDRGRSALILCGQALRTIRDKKLYRSTHGTFEEFCEQTLEASTRRAYQLIHHAETIDDLKGIELIVPAECEQLFTNDISEAATREISDLSAEQKREVVKEATAGGKKPTAKAVKEARERVAPKQRKGKSQDAATASDATSGAGTDAAPDIILDDLNRPVPNRLRPAYHAGQAIRGIVRRLDAIRRELEDATKAAGGEFLEPVFEPVADTLKEVKREVFSHTYWTECDCDGECQLCDGCGWVPHGRSGSLSKKQKEEFGVK